MELPDSVIKFAESIGSVKCRDWSAPNRTLLAGEYSHIKDLQRADGKISNYLERLIETTVELDEKVYKREIDGVVSYERLFNGKLPNRLSELERDIWFIPYLMEDAVQWAFLEKTYKSLRASRALDSNFLESSRRLIKKLSEGEVKFKKEFIFQLSATKKSVIERRSKMARILYPGAFRVSKSEIDHLKNIVHSRAIGLGLKSTFKGRVVRADDVVFDEHTTPLGKNERYALYIPGWTLNGAFTDSD